MASRQEVLNVLLAQLLEERGLVAAPEEILRIAREGARHATRLPDVLVDFQGLRMAVEAEFASTADARRKAYDKAKQRVDQGIAHVGVAVVYPARLRNAGFHRQKDELAACKLQFAIITEATDGLVQQVMFDVDPLPNYHEGRLNDLVETLKYSYEQLIRDETLELAVEKLQVAIEVFLAAIRVQAGTTERIAAALGMRGTRVGRPLQKLDAKQRKAVNRIGGLIVVNALIFQEVLSQKDARVEPLARFERDPDPVVRLRGHWRFILDRVNYYSIFYMANEVLNCLAADPDLRRALSGMVEAAHWVVGRRASLRHDLAGRIFHRILAEAKHLGAYYTAIPAATMLLRLALHRNGDGFPWSSMDALRGLTIADLACGTGTLLMAAADAVIDNHLRACVDERVAPDLDGLHGALVERVIYGYDVLPSAIHLTASTLALRVPDAPINVTHLSCLRLGGVAKELGSLEFFGTRGLIGTLFSRPETAGEGPARGQSVVTLPDVDLCVMNPPFTSSRQPNLLFGNVPAAERTAMQQRLRKMVRKGGIRASITAGMAALFSALGDKCLKPGGRMALVLPRAILSGVAWEETRDLLAEKYRLEYVICSHVPGQWNFSENSKFSEALVIARKRNPADQIGAEGVTCVNLWQQPRNAVEALAVARSMAQTPPDLETGQGAMEINAWGRKFGEAVSIPWNTLKFSEAWDLPCAFAQTELIRSFYHLHEGRLYLPGQGLCGDIALTPLGGLGFLGPDPRDVYDGFDLSAGVTDYPALWGHDAARVNRMEQSPNQYLQALTKAKAGRPLRKAEDLWPRAGRVHLVQRIRLTTKRMLAVRLTEEALADVWWPVTFAGGSVPVDQVEKIIVLWFNSTLGFLLLLGAREETEGAWVQFKKPALRRLPVLDPSKLTAGQRNVLARTYDRLASAEFLTLPEIQQDRARTEIDSVLAHTLGVPDWSGLRKILAREPLISESAAGSLPTDAVAARSSRKRARKRSR